MKSYIGPLPFLQYHKIHVRFSALEWVGSTKSP